MKLRVELLDRKAVHDFRRCKRYIGVVDGYGKPVVEYGWDGWARGGAIMKKKMRIVATLLVSWILHDVVFIVSISSVIFDLKSVFKGEVEQYEDIGA